TEEPSVPRRLKPVKPVGKPDLQTTSILPWICFMAQPQPHRRSRRLHSDAKLSRAEQRALAAPVGWWRYSPVIPQQTSDGRLRLRVFWGKAAAAAVILGFSAWIGGAAAAYLFVKYRRNFPEVRFTHMLLYP